MAPLKPPPTITTVLAAMVMAGFLFAIKSCLHIHLHEGIVIGRRGVSPPPYALKARQALETIEIDGAGFPDDREIMRAWRRDGYHGKS